jgi:hypothetical protein
MNDAFLDLSVINRGSTTVTSLAVEGLICQSYEDIYNSDLVDGYFVMHNFIRYLMRSISSLAKYTDMRISLRITIIG